MGYQFTSEDNNSGNNVQRGNFKPADAFLNLYLPKPGGGKGKLEPAIRLFADNADHKQLMDLFEKDPEGTVELVRNALIMQYNRADGERQLFDLGQAAQS